MMSKTREWLESQGFLLEMRTAAALRDAGFEVRQSTIYVDPEEGKAREIDVVAIDPDVHGAVDIQFLVECKATKKPWVLLCSPDTLRGYNRIFAFAALSEKARFVLAERIDERLLAEMPWMAKDGLTGYSLRQALTDADTAYGAAIGVAKACESLVNPPQPPKSAPPYVFAFPVIVIDAPLIQCSLGSTGGVELQEVNEGEFLFLARLPGYFGACIRVVTSGHLPVFARQAKAVANALRTELKGEERKVARATPS